MSDYHQRDFIGYGGNSPRFSWPNNCKLALNFSINYEEGAESNIIEGDRFSENHLCEMPRIALRGERDLFSESIFEYGARVGIWRLLRLFEKYNISTTLWTVGKALERNPEVATEAAQLGHEIAAHGYRWLNYHEIDRETEAQHIEKTIAIISNLTGNRPYGWFSGRCSFNTRQLLCENRFLYDSDSFADDLPYWQAVDDKWHLIVPFTIDNNDAKYFIAPGFSTGNDFYQYLRASFDTLYEESSQSPKMMSVCLHARISGRPGRTHAIEQFIKYVQQHKDVWICKRLDLAKFWTNTFPPSA